MAGPVSKPRHRRAPLDFDPEETARIVARECAAQDLPLHVYNIAALKRIAELVRSVLPVGRSRK
jgi:hypothetical protein